MRISVGVVVAILLFVSVSCGPRLQPATQGEWSTYHNDKDKISQNAPSEFDQPPAKN
jgi:hypothetical protein